MPPARFELTASGLGILRSIHLSYGGVSAKMMTESFVVGAFICYHQYGTKVKSRGGYCSMQMIFSHTRKHRLMVIGGMTLVLASAGCGSSEPPLAIRMYHRATNQTLHCTAARAQPGQDSAILANAVEACARQLEANGFVRE